MRFEMMSLWSVQHSAPHMAFGVCHSDVLAVLFPDDDIVDEMPELRARMHP